MAPPPRGCSQIFSSWTPATIQMAGVKEMPDEGDTASAGVTESASEPAPSSLFSVPSSALQRGPKERPHLRIKDHAIELCSNDNRDGSRCRHLEECMFPRFLSLDCGEIDDFCMGWNVRNPGRTYIEALHLRDFLKSTEAILSEKNGASLRGSGKRGLNSNTSSQPKKLSHPSTSKKIKVETDARVADSGRLSQAYLGGMEGKRTWLLQNSHSIHAKKEASTYDKALDDLISSEIDLVSSRRAMRINDQSIPIYFNEDDELKRLMNLVKPLPGFSPPNLESSGRVLSPIEAAGKTIDEHQVSNRKAMSSGTPSTLPDFHSHVVDINGNKDDTCKSEPDERIDPGPIVSNGTVIPPQSPNESPLPPRENAHHANRISKTRQSSRHLKSEYPLHEGKEAALSANKLIESFRRNRRNVWAQQHKPEKAYTCAWCPASRASFSKAGTSSIFQFGVVRDNIVSEKDNSSCLHDGASGDALIQCLECNLVGCAPNLLNKGSGGKVVQHAMLHFLMSGHRFGVTCGPLGEIFCMPCGNVIHHECFDQERERLFLEHNIPTLCWSETPIIRGIDPSSFCITPENGVVWRGMMATYPTPVSSQYVEASRLAIKRSSIFRGDGRNRSMKFGSAAVKFSMFQLRHAEDLFLPIGMYNLGNTCYMTATLQCLIHCKPLRELFLHDLAHPYQSCRALRLESNKSSCLACELDKVFLEYYGSAVGIDAIAALEEHLETSSGATPTDAKEQTHATRGHPIIPTSILAESWRNRGMKCLASHGQHDAQEYFNAFVDCLATHTLAYHKCAQGMRQDVQKPQIKRLHSRNENFSKSDTDFIRNTFKGTLRSVLICQKCGSKRTQTESFSNVSLPLAKEFPIANAEARGSQRRGKISVEICLDHFTRPETLSDPVFCVSCNSKTKTQKQHTFSKLPNVLCMHLKRFNSAGSKKITDFISFPAHDLDMGKHLPHWCEQGLDLQDKSVDDICRVDSPKILYDLFATVNHRGTLNQGHYTANVKCGNRWYSCNDALITTLGDGDGEKEVLSSEDAYMLFYQKRCSFGSNVEVKYQKADKKYL